MVDNGEHVSLTLRREFGEEALNSLDNGEGVKKHIEELFKKGVTVRMSATGFICFVYSWI